MANVTQDSSSLRYVPANTTEWTQALTGTGVASPSSFWLCQETSADLADSGTGGLTGFADNTPTYQNTATGWTRKGVGCTDNSSDGFVNNGTPGDMGTTSCALLQFFSLNGLPAGDRHLNQIGGGANYQQLQITSAGKLKAYSGGNTATGSVTHAGTVVVLTKYDRSRSEVAVYTQGEKITPTYVSASGGNTTMYLLGGGSASDATLTYAAFWSGTDAEMSDAQVQALLDALEGNMTTRQKAAAGSMAYKTVVAIEGYEGGLISDAPAASVLAAWHGYDWTEVLGGLYVTLQNHQALQRDAPITTHGRCTIRVVDETREDTLGKAIHRRLSGAETPITQTLDRNDTTINVKDTTNFTSSGTVYIGTEAIAYTGKTGTSFTGCTRGKYSPFPCHTSGSGGLRFGGYHRVGGDANHVQMEPIVSQLPRMWMGKRVGVWLHTWDEANQALNHRSEAQLVYAGRIVQIGDDAHNPSTVIELDHIASDIKNTRIGGDLFKCTLASGLYIPEGRVFKFKEWISGSAVTNANDMTVVAGAPASANELQAGYYMPDELCAAFSHWIGSEKVAGRVFGSYDFRSPVSTNDGPRTKCHWQRSGGSYLPCSFGLEMPGEVFAFLGIGDGEPGDYAQSEVWTHIKMTNAETPYAQGKKAPFSLLMFKPSGPGRLSQEFGDATKYEAENESGEFVDQFGLLPQSIKGSCDSSKQWGVFLLDEKVLIVGSFDTSTGIIDNCWFAPFQLTGDNAPDAKHYIGRRVDEPERGPVTLRQVLVLEERWGALVKYIMYSSGTSGYNHGTYDALGYALSANIPGSLFGPEFDAALDNMPGADLPVVVVIDEPTKLLELLAGDLMLRRAFIRWKDQHFEFSQWRTPHADAALASLTEDNKASADKNPQFRCSSVLSSEYARPTIKFDYSRDFAIGRNDNFQRSFGIEDQTQVDDMGGNVPMQTIKLRNTFAGTSSVGAGLDSLLHDYIAAMPIFRPALTIERSIDQRYYHQIAPGDIVTSTDTFARDPLTGERGITDRAAMVLSHSYSMGGFTVDGGLDPQSGRTTLGFLDVQRGETYAPAAMVDYSASSGGFSAGYNNGTSTLRCIEHAYSNPSTLAVTVSGRTRIAEENDDATYFDAGDEVLIIEIDPSNPAGPTYWERTVLSQSGQDITLTTGLSAPAWDATKKYRIVPQKWSQVQASQQDWSYQADDADHLIEDDEVPFHYSSSDNVAFVPKYQGRGEPTKFEERTSTEQGEYIPEFSYGDGRPYDVGHDRGLINSINAYYDRKSAHQSPMLWHTLAYADLSGSGSSVWNTLFGGIIFLGMDMLSSRVTRTLTVAPFFRSKSGGDAFIRVTIGRDAPTEGPDALATYGGGASYANPKFTGAFSQTSTWSTTSTTWQTGADKTLNVGVKEVQSGLVWIVIEGGGQCESYGLAKCIEGIRTVG